MNNNKLTLQQNVIDEYVGKIKLMSSAENENLKPSHFLKEEEKPKTLADAIQAYIGESIPEPPPRPKAWWEQTATPGQTSAFLSELLNKIETLQPLLTKEQTESVVTSLNEIAKAAALYVTLNTPVAKQEKEKPKGWFA